MTTPVIPADAPVPVAATARRAWPLWLCAIVAAVLMFANYLLAVPVMLLANVAGLPQDNEYVGNGINLVASLVTLATAVWLIRLVARRNPGTDLRGVGWMWTRDSLKMALLGAAAMGVGIVASTFLPFVWGSSPDPLRGPGLGDLAPGLAVLVVVTGIAQAIALQGIPEELVWRGWLMNTAKNRPYLVLAVSALGFGAMHYVSAGGQEGQAEHLLYCLHAATFAFLAGALALRFGSLWCAVGVHAGMHLTGQVLAYFGHVEHGPNSWLVDIVICLALGGAALATWRGTRVEYHR